MKKNLVLIAALTQIAALSAPAATIAFWNFNDQDRTADSVNPLLSPVDVTDINLWAKATTASLDSTFENVNGQSEFVTWPSSTNYALRNNGNLELADTTRADVLEFRFSITVPTTQTLSLTNISFFQESQDGGTFEFFINGNSQFSGSVRDGSSNWASDAPANPPTFVSETIALSGLTGIVNFAVRFVENDIRRQGIDDLLVEGDFTPIPEPSSFALLGGLLGLAIVMMRRRSS